MAQDVWTIDPDHSSAEFRIRHLMVSTVRGHFGSLSGEIVGDPSDLTTAQATLTIDVASVDTRQKDRDAHLRSADFFDVENYPTMTFQSIRIERTGPDTYDVHGDMSIHGTTNPITVAVEALGTQPDPWGGVRSGFTATTTVSRKAFGMTWNQALETGGIMVGDEVKVTVELETVKA